jgi:hypothetical protein
VIRHRDGLAPWSPAADRIEELSYSRADEWEPVLEELSNVEAISQRTDRGSSWIDHWSSVIEETERAIARAKRRTTSAWSENQ